MREQRKPHDIMLQAMREQYTYDREDGHLYKNGRLADQPNSCGYCRVCVTTTDPTYLAMHTSVQAHQIVWYLHYGEWAITEIDHIDGNTINNRVENLRLASHAENLYNSRKTTKPTTSRYKGVYWHTQRQKWSADIIVNGKRKHLGLFRTEEEAAKARDDAAIKLHGEFARLNIPR